MLRTLASRPAPPSEVLIRTLLNYARLTDSAAEKLRQVLHQSALEVSATVSYKGERPDRFRDGIRGYMWRDYGPSSFSVPWANPRPEEVLSASQFMMLLSAAERPGPYDGGSQEAYIRLQHDMALALRILDEVDPELVLSLDLPENPLDFMILKFAIERGIQVLCGRQGVTPYSRLASTDPFKPALAADRTVASHILPRSGVETTDRDASMKAEALLTARTAGAAPWLWGGSASPKVDDRPSHAYRAMQRLRSRSYRLRYRQVYAPLVAGPRFVRRVRDEHAAVAGAARRDEGRTHPRILVALHYQPETTTITQGGWSSNQLAMVKSLADVTPQEYRISVREHPYTFSDRSRVTAKFRSRDFYRRLSEIPRVDVLPVDAHPRALIGAHDFVVTTVGTVGYESLALGRPVVHFGLAGYTNFFGAIQVDLSSSRCWEGVFERIVGLDSGRIAEEFVASSRALERASYHSDAGEANNLLSSIIPTVKSRW